MSSNTCWQKAVFEISQFTEPAVVTYNAAISACGKQRKWQAALQLLCSLEHGRLQPSIVSYNAAMAACAGASLWERTLQLLPTLHSKRLRESAITFLTAISACGKGGHWQGACHLLMEAKRCSAVTAGICNAVITAYDRSMQWQRAMQLIGEMCKEQMVDVISFNAALSACKGPWQTAVLLLSTLESLEVQADQITYNSAITACVKGDSWQMAVYLFGAFPLHFVRMLFFLKKETSVERITCTLLCPLNSKHVAFPPQA